MKLNSLGERLAKTLASQGINQATAATMTGVAKTTISHLIRHRVKAYKYSSALAEGLNVSHDWRAYGRGGLLNPTAQYLPVVHDYFRLKLYLLEGFLEESTQYIVTEQDYGNGTFATIIDGRVLICTPPPEDTGKGYDFGFLLWTEHSRTILSKCEPNSNVFVIQECRQYGKTTIKHCN